MDALLPARTLSISAHHGPVPPPLTAQRLTSAVWCAYYSYRMRIGYHTHATTLAERHRLLIGGLRLRGDPACGKGTPRADCGRVRCAAQVPLDTVKRRMYRR